MTVPAPVKKPLAGVRIGISVSSGDDTARLGFPNDEEQKPRFENHVPWPDEPQSRENLRAQLRRVIAIRQAGLPVYASAVFQALAQLEQPADCRRQPAGYELLARKGRHGRACSDGLFDPSYGIRYGSNFQPFVNKDAWVRTMLTKI